MKRGLEFARKGPVGILTDWRLFTREEIASDAFEQEVALPNNCFHYAGTFIPFASGSFLVIDVERSATRGIYGGLELDNLAQVLAQSSVSISYALRAQASLTQNLVDSLSLGHTAYAWLDGQCAIHHSSANFDELVGRFVGVRNGKVTTLGEDLDLLQWLITQASAGEQHDLKVELRNPSDSSDVATVRVVPLRTIASRLAPRADVLLAIEVCEKPAEKITDILRTRYRLTPAEVRLVLHLHAGLTLRSAAETEGISYETARTRLGIIFGKLSVGRQSELIRMIDRL